MTNEEVVRRAHEEFALRGMGQCYNFGQYDKIQIKKRSLSKCPQIAENMMRNLRNAQSV
jgi:hypothetical protein